MNQRKTEKREYLTITNDMLSSGMAAMITKITMLGLDPNKTAIIAITRGGMVPAQYAAYALGVIDMYTIQSILYDGDDEQKSTQQISGVFNIPYEEYDNIIIIDDLVDRGTTLLNVTTALEETCDDMMGVYTDNRPTFIPCAVYTKKSKKYMRKHDIIFGRKIKKVDGVAPWLSFPWDFLSPSMKD